MTATLFFNSIARSFRFGDADTAALRDWAGRAGPNFWPGGCPYRDDRRSDLTRAGGRRRRVPRPDRAAPPRAPGALLPDARLLPGRRGRAAGHAAGRLAGPRGFAGRASIRTWLYRIATNRCLNARRAAGRRPAKEWNVPGVEPPEPTRLN